VEPDRLQNNADLTLIIWKKNLIIYFLNAVEKHLGQFSKNYRTLPKKLSLCSLKYGFEIRDLEKTHSGSLIQGSKRHWIPDLDPHHWFIIVDAVNCKFLYMVYFSSYATYNFRRFQPPFSKSSTSTTVGESTEQPTPKKKNPHSKGMTRHGTEEARQRKNDQPFKLYCKTEIIKFFFKNLF
jgi:hypothetical protein